MLKRYERNLNTLSEAEVEFLSTQTAAVVGCGGLGGYLIEYLGRLGIGMIIAADGDLFEETNLNRQLLCDVSNLGENKAEAAVRRMAAVNPAVTVQALKLRIDAVNGPDALRGANVILDAVDGIASRLALQETAEFLGIPLVHGAVAGWYGQVATIYPGDRTLDKIYKNSGGEDAKNRGIETRLGNVSFGPALVASLQAAETVKVLLGREVPLRGKLLAIDLLQYDFETLDFRESGVPDKEETRP